MMSVLLLLFLITGSGCTPAFHPEIWTQKLDLFRNFLQDLQRIHEKPPVIALDYPGLGNLHYLQHDANGAFQAQTGPINIPVLKLEHQPEKIATDCVPASAAAAAVAGPAWGSITAARKPPVPIFNSNKEYSTNVVVFSHNQPALVPDISKVHPHVLPAKGTDLTESLSPNKQVALEAESADDASDEDTFVTGSILTAADLRPPYQVESELKPAPVPDDDDNAEDSINSGSVLAAAELRPHYDATSVLKPSLLPDHAVELTNSKSALSPVEFRPLNTYLHSLSQIRPVILPPKVVNSAELSNSHSVVAPADIRQPYFHAVSQIKPASDPAKGEVEIVNSHSILAPAGLRPPYFHAVSQIEPATLPTQAVNANAVKLTNFHSLLAPVGFRPPYFHAVSQMKPATLPAKEINSDAVEHTMSHSVLDSTDFRPPYAASEVKSAVRPVTPLTDLPFPRLPVRNPVSRDSAPASTEPRLPQSLSANKDIPASVEED